MSQTGGPRNQQKMPARLAARGGGSRRNESDGRAEEPEDARPSDNQSCRPNKVDYKMYCLFL